MPETQLPPRGVRHHLIYLLLATAVVIAAFVLEVTPEDRVGLRNTTGALLPPLCVTNTYLGVKCPGCGLTRSFVHLAHGDVWSSIRSHRLGWLLAGLTLAQIPYRLYEMKRPGKAKVFATFGHWMSVVLVVLMLANWAGEVLFFR